jgi:hypothetical protein
MKVVHKFGLYSSWTTFAMEPEAEVLCLFWQDGRPTIWALVPDLCAPENFDKDAAPTDTVVNTRTFVKVGTGEPIPDDYTYIGTLSEGRFIWHFFEVHNE